MPTAQRESPWKRHGIAEPFASPERRIAASLEGRSDHADRGSLMHIRGSGRFAARAGVCGRRLNTGTGKTHRAIAMSIRACLAGQRVQFQTATEWVARRSEAKRQDNLEAELRRLSFIPLLVIDLCRYRDYADIVTEAGLNALRSLGFSPLAPAGLSA